MPNDVIEQYHGQTIQHGQYNDRIYLMKFSPDAGDAVPDLLKDLAVEKNYSKIFAKVPEQHVKAYGKAGFICEAQIPQFFQGEQAVHLMSYYLNPKRQVSKTAGINDQVMAACGEKDQLVTLPALPDGMTLRICIPNEAKSMAKLYHHVFPTYPFPIDDPAYIRQTMVTHVIYFGIWKNGTLIALSSAEMDMDFGNVEMTDFATDPSHRGQGLACILLAKMEQAMRNHSFSTAYTIARSVSFGMNITFKRMGYAFGGRLINNTQISGQFEDMNIWFKSLNS